MLVAQKEVDAFDAAWAEYDEGTDGDKALDGFFEWLTDHPHLMMTDDFVEFVPLHPDSPFVKPWVKLAYEQNAIAPCRRPLFRSKTGQWLLLSSLHAHIEKLPIEDPLKFSQWGFHSSTTLASVALENEEYAVIRSYEYFSDALRKALTIPINSNRTIISPRLWTPETQESESCDLRVVTQDILKALIQDNADLSTIHWRTLEDIVAELLRDSGMEIYRVRESPQGGRDILARGHLIPGQEPITIAVEVKHKDVVYRPDVELALHQNKEFPALMFATSGKFSAGVLEESALPENQLRLFLKDGVAIGDLMTNYGLNQGWV